MTLQELIGCNFCKKVAESIQNRDSRYKHGREGEILNYSMKIKSLNQKFKMTNF